jgi:hypothetical protein
VLTVNFLTQFGRHAHLLKSGGFIDPEWFVEVEADAIAP